MFNEHALNMALDKAQPLHNYYHYTPVRKRDGKSKKRGFLFSQR